MKEGDFIPEKRLRFPKQEAEKIDKSKRMFVAGLGATAGSLLVHDMVRNKLSSALSEKIDQSIDKISLNERLLEAAKQIAQSNLRSPDVLEALQGRGEDPLGRVLRAIEFPILPSHLEGTSYDVKALRRYPVQISIEEYPEAYSLISATNHPEAYKQKGYGNRIYLNSDSAVVTAAHNLEGMPMRGKGYYQERDLDVDIWEVDGTLRMQDKTRVIIEDRSFSNTDIHGQFVSIVGIDPDATGDALGHKTYPGIAVKITPGFARAISSNANDRNLDRRIIGNSFMIVLPPGEAKPHGKSMWKRIDPLDDTPRRAAGMSGSPVFVRRGGAYSFGGVFWATRNVNDAYRNVDIGFFHGIDEVRRAINMTLNTRR